MPPDTPRRVVVGVPALPHARDVHGRARGWRGEVRGAQVAAGQQVDVVEDVTPERAVADAVREVEARVEQLAAVELAPIAALLDEQHARTAVGRAVLGREERAHVRRERAQVRRTLLLGVQVAERHDHARGRRRAQPLRRARRAAAVLVARAVRAGPAEEGAQPRVQRPERGIVRAHEEAEVLGPATPRIARARALGVVAMHRDDPLGVVGAVVGVGAAAVVGVDRLEARSAVEDHAAAADVLGEAVLERADDDHFIARSEGHSPSRRPSRSPRSLLEGPTCALRKAQGTQWPGREMAVAAVARSRP